MLKTMTRHIMMQFRTISPFTLSMLTLACLPLGSFGQQTAQQSAQPAATTDKPALTMHVQAREVLLPVTVRDKHGALVTDLQKSDFTLTEDGRPQVIKSFARETQSALPAGAAGGYQPQRVGRDGE